MDALDPHLTRIKTFTKRDWHQLLEHFAEQCDPLKPSSLRPIRPGRVPEDEWEGSPEYRALASMLGRCWPSEQAQNS